MDPEEGARDPELEEEQEQEQEEAPVMVCQAGYTLLDDNDADAGRGEASLGCGKKTLSCCRRDGDTRTLTWKSCQISAGDYRVTLTPASGEKNTPFDLGYNFEDFLA